MLEVAGLAKQFNIEKHKTFKALNDVSLKVEDGQFFTLLGPSGCGKSTLLRCIAGLEDPDQGAIILKSRDLFSSARRINLSASRRHIGMVFQSYAIWPHMTVFENVAFPLRVPGSKLSKAQIATEVERALAIVQLDEYAGRQSTRLSGGQQQRLALARAIVIKPQLLLLDEPLSNLDAKLRENLRFELKKLQQDLGITTIYVTHDQNEALALSDVIAVMKDGEIQQIGAPREIYNQPNSMFVADFVGAANFLNGQVVGMAPSGGVQVTTAIGLLTCRASEAYAPSDAVLVSFRPENLLLQAGPADASAVNSFSGTVTASVFSGDYLEVRVLVNQQLLKVKVAGDMAIRAGDAVQLTIKPDKAMLVGARRTEVIASVEQV